MGTAFRWFVYKKSRDSEDGWLGGASGFCGLVPLLFKSEVIDFCLYREIGIE